MTRLLLPLVLLFFSLNLAATAEFTDAADALLKTYVRGGGVDYASIKKSGKLPPLVAQIAETDLGALAGNERKAFLINAYNLLVINQVVEQLPLRSVLDVKGFFDANRQTVGGRQLTLNQLEKDLLLKETGDARLHFVLVCGALGCPPITDFAYRAAKLDAQLDRQTRLALNDADFIRVSGDAVAVSKIFEWYAGDFGGGKSGVRAFIAKYRNSALPEGKLTYYEYDWALNQAAPGRADNSGAAVDRATFQNPATNNAARYVVSSTIRKGTAEIKIFNNLYRQQTEAEDSDFFTATVSALYGVTDRFNAGIELRARRASYRGGEADVSRGGIPTIGPKIRVAPFTSLPNFSIQSALWLPIGDDLTGAETGQRYLDWDGATWFTQIFNDFPIGGNFSLFAELDVLLEDIGPEENGRINRFSTPVTGIFSYFPTPKTTLYALGSYSPYWQQNFDYFYQAGLGAKYQFTPNFELELLATAFQNDFLSRVGGSASTLNLGVRFNL